MYFNSQFFPQFTAQGGVAGMMSGSGSLSSHGATNNSMQHSMNMLYMDSLQRQDHCSSGQCTTFFSFEWKVWGVGKDFPHEFNKNRPYKKKI